MTQSAMEFITFVLVIVFAASGSTESGFSSTIDFHIRNTGFHRDLQYSLAFIGPLHKHNCEFMLVQNLPASVFVNTDQLNDLKRLKQIEAYVPVYMDVEIPASKAFHVQIYMFGDVNRLVNVSLPIHFRYQVPTDLKFVRVEIYSPSMYIRCDPKVEDQKMSKEEEFPCRSSSLITDYDKIKNIDICLWQEFEFFNEPTTLSVLIPSGNIHSYKIVLPITIIISWLGCCYITYIVIKKTKNFKIKVY